MNADMQSYLVEQATFRARLLSITARFPSADIEDVRQELLLDCLRRASKFDAARGEWGGFVRGVMRNRAALIATSRFRSARREVFAADLAHGAEDAELAVFEASLAQSLMPDLDYSIDVRRVVDQLPVNLRYLASLLIELTVKEICTKTGRSRSRVYQLVRELRDAFLEAGFRPQYPRKSAVRR
jgi:DNA-directed RNA polymerase specialized sigma24 family protein